MQMLTTLLKSMQKNNSDGGIEVAEDAAKEKEMSQDKEKSEKPKKRKKRAKS